MVNIRQALISDIPELKELYQNTVLNINRKDYSQEEVEDWASCGDDINRFVELFAEQYYIVAIDEQDKIVGFASVNDSGYMHTLFVHQDCQRQGIATLLYNHLKKYAQARGAKRLSSEVSITAKPFFEKQGFHVDEVQNRRANNLCLINYKMSKALVTIG